VCGRYTLTVPLSNLVDAFEVSPPEFDYRPRYNIAPTQLAPVVAQDAGGRRLGLLQWGLVPSWARDPAMGSRLINARSETVEGKPSFRSAFRRRRCLIPADGFFEWRKAGSAKRPFWIHDPARKPFAFAGLWEKWEPKTGDPLYTYSILTREAVPEIRDIHPRMPVILPESEWSLWTDPDADAGDLLGLFREYRGPRLSSHPVSTRVNAARNDDPSCIEPVSSDPSPSGG
jgi:putative SOS response-associated peptidase YedK